MLKNKKLGCLSLLLLSPMAMAMQPLDDQSLSATTGQDGISVGVNLSKVNFNQAAIIDTDGFTTTALGSTVALTSKAALVMAATQGRLCANFQCRWQHCAQSSSAVKHEH